MALYTYLQLTQRLLADVKQGVFNDGDLTAYVNVARGQVAGEGNCVRKRATLPITLGTRAYPFSAIVFDDPTGVSGVYQVRMASLSVATGQAFMRPRAWEWFELYSLNHPVPSSGPPALWAQYAQGSLGSLYVDPLPDADGTLLLDTAAVPIALTDDSTAEAIPFPWTDAVPFFAAAYALASRPEEAAQKAVASFKLQYREFMANARRFANPSTNPHTWEQAQDMVTANRLAVQPTQGGG